MNPLSNFIVFAILIILVVLLLVFTIKSNSTIVNNSVKSLVNASLSVGEDNCSVDCVVVTDANSVTLSKGTYVGTFIVGKEICELNAGCVLHTQFDSYVDAIVTAIKNRDEQAVESTGFNFAFNEGDSDETIKQSVINTLTQALEGACNVASHLGEDNVVLTYKDTTTPGNFELFKMHSDPHAVCAIINMAKIRTFNELKTQVQSKDINSLVLGVSLVAILIAIVILVNLLQPLKDEL